MNLRLDMFEKRKGKEIYIMMLMLILMIEMNLRTLTGLTRGRVRRTPTSAAISNP